MNYILISRRQKRLLPVKELINFAKADESREDSFSTPLRSKPLYLIDFKRTVEIVRAQPGEQKQTQRALMHNDIKAFLFVPTETILKHLHDLCYYVLLVPGPQGV